MNPEILLTSPRKSTDAIVWRTYFDMYPDLGDRMIAIMKNIVKNKGTFIPEKFPLKK